MTLVDRWDFLGDLASAWGDARKVLGATLRTASRVVDRIKAEIERWLDVITLDDAGLITLHGLVTVNSNGLVRSANTVYTAAAFNKSDTTLATVTGLSLPLEVGTWSFRAELPVTADAAGGHKYAVSGTLTASAIWYEVVSVSNTALTIVISSRQSALGGSVGQAGATTPHTSISGTVTVTVAGTLVIQFAQNAASGTSSVIAGASLAAW